MDSRLKFRPRLQRVNNSVGTQEQYASGFVDWPFKGVGECKLAETRVRERGATQAQVVLSLLARKAMRGNAAGVRTVNRHRWARRVA